MPRIGESVLRCVFFLFTDRADAERGEKTGGTGFVMGVPRGWPEPLDTYSIRDRTMVFMPHGGLPGHVGRIPDGLIGGNHLYAVTNWHLINGGAVFARLNMEGGGTKVIHLPEDDWVKHPDQDDVAVYPLSLSLEEYHFQFIGLEQLLSKSLKNELEVGPGDECIIVGRYVDHDGRERGNRPAVRFGFISMMPDPQYGLRTRQPGGLELYLEGYLVEGRSQGGFSGSPVFLYTPPWQLEQEEQGYSARRYLWERTGECSWLLGMNWSHFPDRLNAHVLDDEGRQTGEILRVELNSGMMCVAPAWKILEVLNLVELREQRLADRERGAL